MGSSALLARVGIKVWYNESVDADRELVTPRCETPNCSPIDSTTQYLNFGLPSWSQPSRRRIEQLLEQ